MHKMDSTSAPPTAENGFGCEPCLVASPSLNIVNYISWLKTHVCSKLACACRQVN